MGARSMANGAAHALKFPKGKKRDKSFAKNTRRYQVCTSTSTSTHTRTGDRQFHAFLPLYSQFVKIALVFEPRRWKFRKRKQTDKRKLARASGPFVCLLGRALKFKSANSPHRQQHQSKTTPTTPNHPDEGKRAKRRPLMRLCFISGFS